MSMLDSIASRLGYQKTSEPLELVEKGGKESISQDPLTAAFASVSNEWGIRKASQLTLNTLRRMSNANWVDRTCIFTLRDEITRIPWAINPIDTHQPYDEKFQQYIIKLLNKPNKNNENWRTFIDKIMEDILVVDAGVIEKVRNNDGLIVELYHVDGATIKPVFDTHGNIGDPAYMQFLPNSQSKEAVAEWKNEDMVYIMWNPKGDIQNFGYGMSPVEAGIAVATAFLSAEAYNLQFFRTNTLPPMIINMGKDVQSTDVEKFKTFLASEMKGIQGAFTPVIGTFGDGFDIKQLMKAPTEMGFKDYVEWQMRWKVALYRMSPQDIGFTLDQYKTEGSVQQQLSKNKAIDSLKNVIASYINTEILNDWSCEKYSKNLQFKWIDTDTVDPLDQAKIDDIYLRIGKTTINETRIRDGQEPIIGGEKPLIVTGSQVIALKSDQLNQDNAEETEKSFDKEEGRIVSLKDNPTAISWMDDRGVTQPLFVTDFGKKKGFTIKPSFLDDKKEQEPPEQKVAQMLRAMQVNTPEVQIMSYDQVLDLLPEELYPEFTKYISLEPPYDSQTWRQRWGNTRKSPYYIVTGFISGKDLGNEDLQKELSIHPETFEGAIRDLARVWIAERRFYLGDRKPGHYIITQAGNGFGVDYQFYEDKNSWSRTMKALPATLALYSPYLLNYFKECILDEAKDFGVEKSMPVFLKKAIKPADWEKLDTYTELEKVMASLIQKKIYNWYGKAINIRAKKRLVVRKADDFNPNESYITNGEWVYQNGRKYPTSVIPNKDLPSVNDVKLSPSDYRESYDQGVNKAQLYLKPNMPEGMILSNPEIIAGMFDKRVNYLADTIDGSLRDALDSVIERGINQGWTYGDLADAIQQTLSVDENNPDMPGYRALRIGRTESMWAVNEGMIAQYKEVGVKQVDIEAALTACDLCTDTAGGNPYNLREAEGMLPLHPNCRCVLVGEWGEEL